MEEKYIQLDLAGLKQVQLAAVREILRATTAALPLQDMLPLIVNVTIIAFDALTAWLMLLEDERLHMVVVRGKDSAQLADTATNLATGAIGKAALHPQPVILLPEQIVVDDPLHGVLSAQEEPVVLLPIYVAGQVRGLLGAVVTHEAAQDISFLVTLSEQAAIAIEDARLRSEAHTWRQRLDAVVEQMYDPVMVYDKHGRLLLLNATAERWLQSRGVQIGDTLEDLVRKTGLCHADGTPLANDELASKRAIRGEVVDNLELQFRVLPEQTIHYILANAVPLRTDGQINGAVVVWHDITMHKQMENTLRDLLAREQAAVERLARLQSVTEALSRSLTPQQVVEAIFEKGVSSLGIQAGMITWRSKEENILEIIGSSGYMQDILDTWRYFPVDTPIPMAQAVRTQTAIWLETADEIKHQYPVLASLNASRSIGACVVLPLLSNANCIGSLGVHFARPRRFDAQERAFLTSLADLCAQALERAWLYAAEQEARAEAQEALRIRDAFLSIASHELKTPLTVVLGQAQLLHSRSSREGTLNPRDQRALAAITDQASQLNALITSMLDVSHIERGQLAIIPAPVDVCDLARRLVASVQMSLEQHTLAYQIPETPIIVEGDASRLEQIVNNLLSNAIKYSPHGGLITIDMTRHDATVCIAISDQGIGIPADALPSLFQRFYRADNALEYCIRGTGIGLYVVKELVTLHSGRITVESTEGQGTTFRVYLPVAESESKK